jgi:hypothetical protein
MIHGFLLIPELFFNNWPTLVWTPNPSLFNNKNQLLKKLVTLTSRTWFLGLNSHYLVADPLQIPSNDQ